MPSRLNTLLLAVVLFWSGLSAGAAPRIDLQAPPVQTIASVHAESVSGSFEGSVEHHHLDDLLSQALSEPPPETPGLLAAPLAPRGAWMAKLQPCSPASAESGPPFLAGPLRPPCDTTLAG